MGSLLRERGTIHHARFSGPAINVARQGGIGITPRKGWWTDDIWKDAGITMRYALIVSIRSPEITQDIYQAAVPEVANMARTRIKALLDLSVKPTTVRKK